MARLILALLFFMVPGYAMAEREIDLAKQHFTDGEQLFESGNYPAALAEFQAAYQLSMEPLLLFDLGKTAEKLGQLDAAIGFYKRFIVEADTRLKSTTKPPKEEDAKELRETQAAVEKRLKELAPAPTSQQGPISLPPSRPGSGPRHRPPAAGIALVGGGSAVLAVGLALTLTGLSDANAIRDSPFYVAGAEADYAAAARRYEAGIALSVAGGLGLTSGIIWLVTWRFTTARDANNK